MHRGKRIELFVDVIWAWYARHKRTLPWRDLQDAEANLRAYKVLVSEIMLQQTQVPRVILKYKEFVQRFPTIQELASASNRDVIMAWRGMGYNTRALRLRDAARYILGLKKPEIRNPKLEGNSNFAIRTSKLPSDFERRASSFPTDMETLQSIPGIGHYTAAAIRNFAFNISTPCIDTNIRRILHRTFIGPENADGRWRVGDDMLLRLAEDILRVALQNQVPHSKFEGNSNVKIPNLRHSSNFGLGASHFRGAAEWHAALMDFGSLVQTKRNPRWDICPLTAAGIMRATKKNFESGIVNHGKFQNSKFKIYNSRKEPGRLIEGRFIPNRIIRGLVVELLRDAQKPLTLEAIGREVCIDWAEEEHRGWLRPIIEKLCTEGFLSRRASGFRLRG